MLINLTTNGGGLKVLTGLHTISMAGERMDICTFNWIQEILPKNVLVNDN